MVLAALVASPLAGESTPALQILHPRLVEALDLLTARSPTMRAGVEDILAAGIPVRVGYVHQFNGRYDDINPASVAGVFPVGSFMPGDPVLAVDVVFFTTEMEQRALAHGYGRRQVLEDIALILAHELHGHVGPLVAAEPAVWPSPCADRDRGGRPGCAILRENRVRIDLGLAPRGVSHSQSDLGLLCAGVRRCRPMETNTHTWLAYCRQEIRLLGHVLARW